MQVEISIAFPKELVSLTRDTWHVLLQSKNVFELGGVTNVYVDDDDDDNDVTTL